MSHALASIFAPGFFSNAEVEVAATVGAAVAIVAGAVGVFTVMRGQSFAGEALGDIATTGGLPSARSGGSPQPPWPPQR